MTPPKTLTQVPSFEFKDFIEIVFGILVGLFFFLTGGTEMFTMGALLNDYLAIILLIFNLFLLFGMTRLVAGKIRRGFLLIESVRHPLRRALIVYSIGFLISFSVYFWLSSVGYLEPLIKTATYGILPLIVKITIFSNFFSTLLGLTVDLSIVE